MWPNDYITWAQTLYHRAYRLARGALMVRNNDPFFQVDVPSLAQQARHAAFELARQHLPIIDYFADFNAFNYWIMAVVSHQVARLYLLHPTTQPRLNGLPPLERRVLGLVFVDRLTDSEAATLLGIPFARVRPLAHRALGII
jgi:hypothetical protein